MKPVSETVNRPTSQVSASRVAAAFRTGRAHDDPVSRADRALWLALRRLAADFPQRVRARGWSALARVGRMTGATVVAFVVAELLGLRNPPPLIAALTALLVVQATLASTLITGVQ
jgi:hypothetical protein